MAVRLDETAEGVCATNSGGGVLQHFQPCREELRLAYANTCLDDGRKQHLVHGLVHRIDEVHGPRDVMHVRVCVQALQQDRARDPIWFHVRLLHLLHECTPFRKLPALEVGLYQCVEGDDVDHARLPRLNHEVFSGLQVLTLDAGVEQRIVDKVVQLRTTRLCGFED